MQNHFCFLYTQTQSHFFPIFHNLPKFHLKPDLVTLPPQIPQSHIICPHFMQSQTQSHWSQPFVYQAHCVQARTQGQCQGYTMKQKTPCIPGRLCSSPRPKVRSVSGLHSETEDTMHTRPIAFRPQTQGQCQGYTMRQRTKPKVRFRATVIAFPQILQSLTQSHLFPKRLHNP